MMEKIYEAFALNVLPKIAEGLTITKDYFFDLFWRYVKYLIVIDSITFIAILIGMIVCLYIIKRMFSWKKKYTPDANQRYEKNFFDGDGRTATFILTIILATSAFIGLFTGLIFTSKLLAKDIFIPEVRIYEQIQEYRSELPQQ